MEKCWIKYTNKHYTNTHTQTCFRIPAAISWPQSKMMWNSLPLFISFNNGLASLVSAGSCRIFNLMLYREGAFISSCNRISPVEKLTKINFILLFCFASRVFAIWKFKPTASCFHDGNEWKGHFNFNSNWGNNYSWFIWQQWLSIEWGYESSRDIFLLSVPFKWNPFLFNGLLCPLLLFHLKNDTFTTVSSYFLSPSFFSVLFCQTVIQVNKYP